MKSPVEGQWKVGDSIFNNKFQALVNATKTQQDIKFIFFDEIWNKFDRSLLGKISLSELYRQRAQQIRDSYDYLILYFSGGADSYNVLRSFLDNDIQLDEVCVKWPMSAVNAGVYTPDSTNILPTNCLSEWDYAIKPVLDWLTKNYPKVKISVIDWSENIKPEIYSLELFQTVNNWNDVEIPFLRAYSSSEESLVNKGKRVGSIYGVDKPQLAYDDAKWYMSFTDTGTGMGVPSTISPENTEYFYWSPNFPLIAFEQAYQLSLYVDQNPQIKKYFFSNDNSSWNWNFDHLSINVRNEITKKVVYDNWIGSFQTMKPEIADRADKQFWIFDHPELNHVRDSYIDMNSLFISQINSRFLNLVKDNTYSKTRGIYKHLYSKWHFVRFIGE